MDYPYRIPYSKTKSYINGLLSILLALASAFTLGNGLTAAETSLWSMLLAAVGLIGVLFFGYAAYAHFQMLYSGKLAVEVDDEGIRDETSKLAVGLVRWKDITGFREHSTLGAKFITVDVANPDHYHNKARGGMARRMMKQNEKMVGSPITINMGNITVPRRELLRLLTEEWNFQKSLRSGPGTPLPELIRLREELGVLRAKG